MYFADLDTNNKVIGVKQVNDGFVNPGNSIETSYYDARLLGTTHKGAGVFEGYYIILTADKKAILADGVDKAVITATVFNWDDTPATTFTTGIVFGINAVQQTVIPTNGVATTEVKSSIAGNFTVKTVNDIMRNGEVIISAS